MTITLEDLKKRIKDTERELDELKAAYKVMERLGQTSPNSHPEAANTSSPTLAETGSINIDELNLPVKAAKSGNSLYDHVRNLVERFGSQEFTVTHVEAALKQMGKGSESKHFKNRVSMAVRKLAEDEGVLERTYKGVGNVPHKYKNKVRAVKGFPVRK